MVEGTSPRSNRARWMLILRITVTVVLCAVLARNLQDPTAAIPEGHHLLTAALLTLAVLTTLAGVVLSAWRWQRAFAVFDMQPPISALTRHSLAGLFVGNALPGTIGGDVVRVTRATQTVGSAEIAFASVVLERLTGFIALPLFVFIGFALQPSLLESDHAWLAMLIAGVTLGVLGTILFLAGHPRLAGRFAHNENWTRFIGAVHLGVNRLRHDPGKAVAIVGTAVLYQASVISVFAIIFRALDFGVPIAAVLAFCPAVMMLQVLPISLNGFGVREGALVLFFSPLGVSREQAFAAGLLWWGALLLVSLLGAPAFAIGQRRRAPEAEAPEGDAPAADAQATTSPGDGP